MKDNNNSKQQLIEELSALRQQVSELQDAKETLEAKERHHKRLLQSVTDYMYSVTVEKGEAVATTHSPNCVVVTGYLPQDYEADPNLWYRMVHIEDQEAVLGQATEILSGGEVPALEHRILHKDGSIRWVRNTPVLRYDAQGDLIGYDGLIADITERKQAEAERESLFAKEREQRLLAETLGEVFLSLTAQTNREAILDEILEQVQRLVAYSAANIVLLDKDKLYAARWYGYEKFGTKALFPDMEQALADFPLDAKVIRSGEPVIVSDTQQDPQWVTVPELNWIRSFMAVPIILQNEVLGLLRLDGETPDKFSVRDVERLLPLARAAAIALENARLYEQVQQQLAERIQAEKKASELNRKFLSLQYAGATIASSLDLQFVLNAFTKEMVDLLNVKGCIISRWKQKRDKVTVIARYGPDDWWPQRAIDTFYSLEDIPLTKCVLTERQAQHVTISQRDIDPVDLAYMQTFQIKTLLLLPMECHNRVIGLVEVMDDEVEHRFTVDEIAFTKLLANQAAAAIENAWLYKKAQQEIAERRQVEHELRYVAQRSQSILDAIPDFMLFLRRDGQILDYKIVDDQDLPPEVSAEMIVGKKLSDIPHVTAHFVDLTSYYIGKTLDSGKIQIFEYRLPTKAGWQDFEARMVVSGQDEVLTIVRNITKRKQTEEALKTSEANLRAIFENSQQAFVLIDRDHQVLAFNRAASIGVKRLLGIEMQAGQSIYEFLPDEYINGSKDNIRSALNGQTVVVEQSLRLRNKKIWFEFHYAPVFAHGDQVIGVCFSSIDIDVRKKATDALAKREARLLEEMQTVLIVTRALVSQININKLLEFIMVQARHLTNAEGAAVLLLSDDGQWLDLATPDDAWSQLRAGLRLLTQGSLAELAIASQRVQVSNQAQDDERTASIRALLRSVKLHTLLCAPLLAHGESLGVLLVWNKRSQVFSTHDNRLMGLFADQAALAWHNARLHAQNRELAIEQERHRLARELHDTVTQSTYSIGMAAQAALRLLDHNSDERVRRPIEYIQKLSQTALTEMRERLHDLHPTDLRDKRLIEALAQHCHMLAEQHDLTIRFKAGSEPSLSMYQQETLYYIAKEALWNVVKYADPTEVEVTLVDNQERIELSIIDDGSGFASPAFDETETMGLRGMKERAKLLGGTFELQSSLGEGTRVLVHIPAQLPEENFINL